MKNIDKPLKDPVLKDLIKQDVPPELPDGFSQRVMNSIRLSKQPKMMQDVRIPIGIKLGIPLFLVVCSLMIILFPGEQSGIFDSVTSTISNSGFVDFFDRLSLKLQSFQFPEMIISKKLGAYIIGGIGLIWMFVLSEGLSRRFSNSGLSDS